MLRLIKDLGWKPLFGLLSPRVFEVVPLGAILSQVGTLGGNDLLVAAETSVRRSQTQTPARRGRTPAPRFSVTRSGIRVPGLCEFRCLRLFGTTRVEQTEM
jgi:hypothetical protein